MDAQCLSISLLQHFGFSFSRGKLERSGRTFETSEEGNMEGMWAFSPAKNGRGRCMVDSKQPITEWQILYSLLKQESWWSLPKDLGHSQASYLASLKLRSHWLEPAAPYEVHIVQNVKAKWHDWKDFFNLIFPLKASVLVPLFNMWVTLQTINRKWSLPGNTTIISASWYVSHNSKLNEAVETKAPSHP